MEALLRQCSDNLAQIPCCHDDSRICNCGQCWIERFDSRHASQDTYECSKSLNFYVLYYGLAYASEVYFYLEKSQILENNFIDRNNISVLSLGCGFAPDLYALSKYIKDNRLNISVRYKGVDSSKAWVDVRSESTEAVFATADVSNDLDLHGYDIVFALKLFSTLKSNNLHQKFTETFSQAVQAQLPQGSFVIFNDINSCYMGRDSLDLVTRRLFHNRSIFYFNHSDWIKEDWNWRRIPNKGLVFDMPKDINFPHKSNPSDSVFFECRL